MKWLLIKNGIFVQVLFFFFLQVSDINAVESVNLESKKSVL